MFVDQASTSFECPPACFSRYDIRSSTKEYAIIPIDEDYLGQRQLEVYTLVAHVVFATAICCSKLTGQQRKHRGLLIIMQFTLTQCWMFAGLFLSKAFLTSQA